MTEAYLLLAALALGMVLRDLFSPPRPPCIHGRRR